MKPKVSVAVQYIPRQVKEKLFAEQLNVSLTERILKLFNFSFKLMLIVGKYYVFITTAIFRTLPNYFSL